MALVTDVAGERHRPAPSLLDPSRRILRVLVLAEVGNQHVGALAGEGDRYGAANAGIAAGDQCNAVSKAATALVALLAMIGHRLHLLGKARDLLRLLRVRRLRVLFLGV